jgi:formylmethanofuran dehydrogenase subunit E
VCDDCGEYYFNENKNYMIDRVVCNKCYNEGEY